MHSFIHSDHLYSASSSTLLLISAPDTARVLCRSFTPKRHRQLQVKDLPKVPMWRLERESNPLPSGRMVSTQPMRHHVPQMGWDELPLIFLLSKTRPTNGMRWGATHFFVINDTNCAYSRFKSLKLDECYAIAHQLALGTVTCVYKYLITIIITAICTRAVPRSQIVWHDDFLSVR